MDVKGLLHYAVALFYYFQIPYIQVRDADGICYLQRTFSAIKNEKQHDDDNKTQSGSLSQVQ